VDLIELKRAYSRAWHSTFAGGWERIRASGIGLASTTTLLDLYGVIGADRARLEEQPRGESEWLQADGLPPVLIRDQKPLLPVTRLERVLDDMSVSDWCRELNRRVYFFVRETPLKRLLAAYPDEEHDVLVIDARKLVDRYEQAITLSPINTGAIAPAYAKRGAGTFVPIDRYPTTATGAPAKPIAEITVDVPIPDIVELTLRVARWRGNVCLGTL